MFVCFCLKNVTPKSETGQDVCAWGTDGLALTKCRFLLKANAFYLTYFGSCEFTKCILVVELEST